MTRFRVAVTPEAAAHALRLLLVKHGAELGELAGTGWTLTFPVAEARTTVLYEVIRASRAVSERHPNAEMWLELQGKRHPLPPPWTRGTAQTASTDTGDGSIKG
jgi:hypothetical protein